MFWALPNWPPMAVRVGTEAKLVPMMTGRPAPIRRKRGKSCRKVASAVMISDAWMSSVFSSPDSLHTPAMMMASVMMPTTAATTCWKPSGTS